MENISWFRTSLSTRGFDLFKFLLLADCTGLRKEVSRQFLTLDEVKGEGGLLIALENLGPFCACLLMKVPIGFDAVPLPPALDELFGRIPDIFSNPSRIFFEILETRALLSFAVRIRDGGVQLSFIFEFSPRRYGI